MLALCLGIAWRYSHRENTAENTSIYRLAAPLDSMPQALIGGLTLLRPEQVVSAPVVDGFQWPCGAPQGAMMYDAQPFGAMNTYRKGHHTGKDINGIGGENTDIGVPVCAAGRGLVVYSGNPGAEWGEVVVLAHRLPGSSAVVQTLYAHLDTREARVGRFVSRGERIGTIGTAGGRYLAHLHFEAIESLSQEAGMPGYHPAGTMNRIDPAKLILDYPAPNVPDFYDEVRRIRIREAAEHRPAPAAAPAAPGVIPVSPEQFL